MYKRICFIAILSAIYSMPAVASKTDELKAACLENPTHEVCQAREAKKAKAKAKREAKMEATILRVKENR